MSEEEDKRQKKYGFMLEPPNVIENYDPKTSGVWDKILKENR